MTRDEVDALLERHFAAELAGDIPGILATFTDDIEHDVVGRQPNPLQGKDAVGAFYKEFLPDLEHTRVTPVRRFYAEGVVIDETLVEGYAHGRPFDLEGYGRPVRFRLLRIFELRDGLISRVNAWFDLGTIRRQLAPPSAD
jgi:ketosteroid isomerase-like protein